MRIAGYTYKADIYCPQCLADKLNLIEFGDIEHSLDHLALGRYDRFDESSFDSDSFPKVVFKIDLDSTDQCGVCGRYLKGVRYGIDYL